MEATLELWVPIDNNNFNYRPNESKLLKTETIQADTENELFRKFFILKDELKYCRGYQYVFQEHLFTFKYNQWLNSDDYKNKSFNLHYRGIVD
jgi:hypothetical protein